MLGRIQQILIGVEGGVVHPVVKHLALSVRVRHVLHVSRAANRRLKFVVLQLATAAGRISCPVDCTATIGLLVRVGAGVSHVLAHHFLLLSIVLRPAEHAILAVGIAAFLGGAVDAAHARRSCVGGRRRVAIVVGARLIGEMGREIIILIWLAFFELLHLGDGLLVEVALLVLAEPGVCSLVHHEVLGLDQHQVAQEGHKKGGNEHRGYEGDFVENLGQ